MPWLFRAAPETLAVPELGLPPLRPQFAAQRPRVRAPGNAGRAGGRGTARHSVDHRQRLSPARAAASRACGEPLLRRGRQRHGYGSAARLSRTAWLSARRDGDGAWRICGPGRIDRPVPGRRSRPASNRPVRRRDRGNPPVRPDRPAQHRPAGTLRPGSGERGPTDRREHRPIPGRIPRGLRRRYGRRPALRSGIGGPPGRRGRALAAAFL